MLTFASGLLCVLPLRHPRKMSVGIKICVSVFDEKYAMFLIKTLFAQFACRGCNCNCCSTTTILYTCASVSACGMALSSIRPPFVTCRYITCSGNNAYRIYMYVHDLPAYDCTGCTKSNWCSTWQASIIQGCVI